MTKNERRDAARRLMAAHARAGYLAGMMIWLHPEMAHITIGGAVVSTRPTQ